MLWRRSGGLLRSSLVASGSLVTHSEMREDGREGREQGRREGGERTVEPQLTWLPVM